VDAGAGLDEVDGGGVVGGGGGDDGELVVDGPTDGVGGGAVCVLVAEGVGVGDTDFVVMTALGAAVERCGAGRLWWRTFTGCPAGLVAGEPEATKVPVSPPASDPATTMPRVVRRCAPP
jgi:hypothetical protein